MRSLNFKYWELRPQVAPDEQVSSEQVSSEQIIFEKENFVVSVCDSTFVTVHL